MGGGTSTFHSDDLRLTSDTPRISETRKEGRGPHGLLARSCYQSRKSCSGIRHLMAGLHRVGSTPTRSNPVRPTRTPPCQAVTRARGLNRVCLALLVIGALVVAGCGSSDSKTAGPGVSSSTPTGKFKGATLRISAIPDQDPEKLNRLYGTLSTYLTTTLGVKVDYVPVTDYTASVASFRIGDLDAVWFGGLTGVQARLQTPGAKLLAQRDIDAEFRSVFIASRRSGIAPVKSVAGLGIIAGHSLTFGSESSTSGRLMPQYFLDQAGVSEGDLKGNPGFSGAHDATIKLVESGTYEVGALNKQVWEKTVADKGVDLTKVALIFESPPFADYHWLARPDLDAKFGVGFTDALREAILALDATNPDQAEVLELFGAKRFVPTEAERYERIESIGRKLGLITQQ